MTDITSRELACSPTFFDPQTEFLLDVSGIGISQATLEHLQGKDNSGESSILDSAHREMQKIEEGEIKNPDENRAVTHFTDRRHYSDTDEYKDVIEFAEEIRATPDFTAVIINGIGGSALGPQFVQQAVNGPYWNELPRDKRKDYPRIYFLDNTDPAGLNDVLETVNLAEALVVNISKSGGTQEMRNNMAALEERYRSAGLEFANHAVAVTMEGSKLDEYARNNNWLKCFPMAESIGGRTSETNIVGHLPAALAGIDFNRLLEGACAMDELTSAEKISANPAYQLGLAWYHAGNGRGDKNMVILPYSDRLILLSRYLQQLVMESLGKEYDRDGNVAHQGITVYGNKGGSDAHAYVQQLNDGRNDFFITFIENLTDKGAFEVEENRQMGDYLHAFKEGLMQALQEKDRAIIDIVMPEVNEYTLGMLIALYERAVAYYAELININAFHQPGVEAYKKAAKDINAVSASIQEWIGSVEPGFAGSAEEVAEQVSVSAGARQVERILLRFSWNRRVIYGRKISRTYSKGAWHFGIEEG